MDVFHFKQGSEKGMDFPDSSGVTTTTTKNPPANAGDVGSIGKIPGGGNRKWQPAPFLPGKSHAQRSLVGYSTWHHKESDMT